MLQRVQTEEKILHNISVFRTIDTKELMEVLPEYQPNDAALMVDLRFKVLKGQFKVSCRLLHPIRERKVRSTLKTITGTRCNSPF